MNAKHYFSVAALCLSMAACNSGKGNLTTGIDLANLDTTALPGTDFYQYACGGWMKNHPLTDEYSQYGSFTVLAENNRKQMQGLIEELAKGQHEAGSVAQKIGTLYNLAMDSVKLNQEGTAPIKTELEEIASLKNKADVYALLGSLERRGITSYLGTGVGADQKNSDMNAVYTSQAGLSMGERDYYLATDEATTKIREAFKVHVAKMYQLAGFDEATANRGRDIVMDVETRLAKTFRSMVELRDPQANYNKMTLDELKQKYASFNWDAYLTNLGLKNVQEIIVGQPEALAEAAKILDSLPVEQQVLYLQWKLIDRAASFLNDEIVEQNFDFYGRTMSGAKERGRGTDVCGEVLPRRCQRAHGDAGQEPADGPGRAHPGLGVDERQHQGAGAGETGGFPRQNRVSGQVEGLWQAGHQGRLLLCQHREGDGMGQRREHGQSREAGRQGGMAHDAADGERLL